MSDLVSFIRSLLAAGDAQGWQSFGSGSEWNGTELGQDIGLPVGTPVPASAGLVTSVVSWGYGDSAVTERLADGTLLTVGHVTPAVAEGQQLSAGQTMAYSRGLPSPISSGPHIEFRVQPGGGTYVDPIAWLATAPANAATPGAPATAAANAAAANPSSVNWRPLIVVGAGLAALWWALS